jgi:hypothetical protein
LKQINLMDSDQFNVYPLLDSGLEKAGASWGKRGS